MALWLFGKVNDHISLCYLGWARNNSLSLSLSQDVSHVTLVETRTSPISLVLRPPTAPQWSHGSTSLQPRKLKSSGGKMPRSVESLSQRCTSLVHWLDWNWWVQSALLVFIKHEKNLRSFIVRWRSSWIFKFAHIDWGHNSSKCCDRRFLLAVLS